MRDRLTALLQAATLSGQRTLQLRPSYLQHPRPALCQRRKHEVRGGLGDRVDVEEIKGPGVDGGLAADVDAVKALKGESDAVTEDI